MGNSIARELEEKLLLGPGWMDLPHESAEDIPKLDVRKDSDDDMENPLGDEPADMNVWVKDIVAVHPEKAPWLRVIWSEAAPSTMLPPWSNMVVNVEPKTFVGDGTYLLRIGKEMVFRKISRNVDGTLRVKSEFDDFEEVADPSTLTIVGKAEKLWEGRFL